MAPLRNIVAVSFAVAQVSAFAPSRVGQPSTLRHAQDVGEVVSIVPPEAPAADVPETPAFPTLNGWTADESKPCFGLPGVIAPTGFLDPLGFCQAGIPLNDVKRYRESEVMHGRVAMLAAVGYLAGEAVSGPFGITGPANDQLALVPGPAFAFLTLCIGVAETYRATLGWVEPGPRSLWTLRENYYPGDLGFDPLGLKPTEAADFARIQTKELQNGRLAMLGVAGMCAQELCNHKTIFETIDFYNKVYSGINPYESV